jgi:hypothetical protein
MNQTYSACIQAATTLAMGGRAQHPEFALHYNVLGHLCVATVEMVPRQGSHLVAANLCNWLPVLRLVQVGWVLATGVCNQPEPSFKDVAGVVVNWSHASSQHSHARSYDFMLSSA